ncbi:MAG TPA: MFS transporter [Acidimicrobiales bacterium]|jgi:predicted MFS family arabinose efflux permease|nr:MFS transporter [Acidimicrobiales bacterium]
MTESLTVNEKKSGLHRGLILLFAVACGLSVANLYYAQTVLGSIGATFHSGSATVGLTVTLAQVGYALGLALLVPVGDIVARRKLVPAVLLLCAVGLVASAVAPSVGVLVVVAALVGLGSVAAQLLVPMAASLSLDHERGRVVGTVMSGLLMGILLARTISGIIAQLSSWRVVYVTAAVMMVALSLLLWRQLPAESERPHVSYGTLLRSTVTFFTTESFLRVRSLFGALAFCVFSIFWTTMAFLLSGSPYHYNDLTIGLFGLVGAAGALCANFAGRWADRRWTKQTTLVFASLLPVSFLPLWIGRDNLAMLILGIILLDIGVQGLQVTNQSLIYRLAPHARSRINSVYMVCYFVGGAIGSYVGGLVYEHAHWAGVSILGAVIGAVATLLAIADSLSKKEHPSPLVSA